MRAPIRHIHRRWGPVLALAVGACANRHSVDPGVGVDSDVQMDAVHGARPIITVDTPVDPTTPGPHLHGMVSDADQPADSLVLTLTSSVDGPLTIAPPGADGAWQWDGRLSAGVHQLTATVTDVDANTASITTNVAVARENGAPACAILRPNPDQRYATGATVSFEARAIDPDNDPVRLEWSSNVVGVLFDGTTNSGVLPDGNHVISLVGDDSHGGRCVGAVTIHVGVVN